ncbi:hypothetical protein [Borrelia persica]|nr:hypothetical protein [Borrelia persica]
MVLYKFTDNLEKVREAVKGIKYFDAVGTNTSEVGITQTTATK